MRTELDRQIDQTNRILWGILNMQMYVQIAMAIQKEGSDKRDETAEARALSHAR